MGAYESLMVKQKDIETIGQISGLLGWDQEVMMPPKAAPLRAEQMAWLSKTRHRLMIDPEMGELLAQAEKEDDGTDSVRSGNLRLMRDTYDKATKQSSEFVERMARHKSKSIISWTEAREKNDFSIFRDDLATMIDLVRELAELLGYENEKYDALLDLYESGLTVARLDPLFAGLRDSSVPLIQSVNQSLLNWVGRSDFYPSIIFIHLARTGSSLPLP